MIWEKLFVCVFDFKISNGMLDENLRSMAVHAIAEMKWVHSSVTIATKTFKFIPYISLLWNEMSAQFGYHSNKDLQIYTIHFPPMKLPGHPSMTFSVAMATHLWCHSTSAMACNACHAPEFFSFSAYQC